MHPKPKDLGRVKWEVADIARYLRNLPIFIKPGEVSKTSDQIAFLVELS